ncbi:MAG: hypothetical protein U0172_14310 [Nitrospiraceae bacterium]
MTTRCFHRLLFVGWSSLAVVMTAALLYGCHQPEEEQNGGSSSGSIERVSIANANVAQANGGSGDGTRLVVGIPESAGRRPGMSGDGRFIVFDSTATNLVPGLSPNGHRQVYLRDRQTNQTEMISLNAAGLGGANGDSYAPVVTDDGDTIVFESVATDLVFGIVDTNQAGDVFLRSRSRRVTERVSQFDSGAPGICGGGGTGCSSYEPSINPSGSIIAFGSSARLTADDVDSYSDIYVLQRGGATTPVLHRATPSFGVAGTAPSQGSPSVSADGRFVAFASSSTQLANLVTVNTQDAVTDIFLYDIGARTTRKVSVAFSGAPTSGHSYSPSVSSDGRFVTFSSTARNLTATFPKTTDTPDIFVADMNTTVPTMTRLSLGLNNQQANGENVFPTISRDGASVAFASRANNFDSALTDRNSLLDIYRVDRACNPCNTRRVSIAIAGRDTDRDSTAPAISADGRAIAFYSDATTLVPNDTNGVRDAFLRAY